MKKKLKTKFLVAVRVEGEAEIFSFNTKKQQASFIKDLEKKFPEVDYATGESKEPYKSSRKTVSGS